MQPDDYKLVTNMILDFYEEDKEDFGQSFYEFVKLVSLNCYLGILFPTLVSLLV